METKTKQFQYETDTWKRSLNFIIDENIHLKNRLTEILKNGFNKKQLAYLEYFQMRFIKEDERIRLVRNDVAEIDKILEVSKHQEGRIMNGANEKLAIVRNNVINAEKQFNGLKLEFNNYMLNIFTAQKECCSSLIEQML